jgi:hypothetical protein
MSPKFIACVLFSIPAVSSAADKPAADETAMSIEGVRAVEDHWTRAFLSGDAAYLDSLLDPQYVSVGHSGRARPKAEIIELSKKLAANPSKDAPPESSATSSSMETPRSRRPAAVVIHPWTSSTTRAADGMLGIPSTRR